MTTDTMTYPLLMFSFDTTKEEEAKTRQGGCVLYVNYGYNHLHLSVLGHVE